MKSIFLSHSHWGEVKVLVAELCPTPGDPMDCSPPGSLSMEFSRQEYRSGLLFPSPGDLPDPGIKPGSPALQADSLPSELKGIYKTPQLTAYLMVKYWKLSKVRNKMRMFAFTTCTGGFIQGIRQWKKDVKSSQITCFCK